jgi:hypothetical protein
MDWERTGAHSNDSVNPVEEATAEQDEEDHPSRGLSLWEGSKRNGVRCPRVVGGEDIVFGWGCHTQPSLLRPCVSFNRNTQWDGEASLPYLGWHAVMIRSSYNRIIELYGVHSTKHANVCLISAYMRAAACVVVFADHVFNLLRAVTQGK